MGTTPATMTVTTPATMTVTTPAKVMMTVTTVTKCAKEKKSIMRDANANVNPLDRPAMPSSPVYQDWQQSWLSHHSLSNLDLRGDISCDFESIPVSNVKQMKRASSSCRRLQCKPLLASKTRV